MNARHGTCGRYHRSDCYSSPSLKAEAKRSQGDPQVIFQGIEHWGPEPESGHINILALTYIINSSDKHNTAHTHSASHTALFSSNGSCWFLSGQMFLVLLKTLLRWKHVCSSSSFPQPPCFKHERTHTLVFFNPIGELSLARYGMNIMCFLSLHWHDGWSSHACEKNPV